MLESLPNFLSEITKFSNLNSNEIDANISDNVNCKYYSVDSFEKPKLEHFSL